MVKNSLALRAAKGTALEQLEGKLEGYTGIAYAGDDPVALAKVLVDFAKDHPALSVKAGIVAGSQLLDAEGVKALSTMPGLPELRARLLGLLQMPATQLVRLLATPASQLARVVKAHQDKVEGQVGFFRKQLKGFRRLMDDERKKEHKMADIQAIANNLSALTVLQASQLVKMLEEKWGVSARPRPR